MKKRNVFLMQKSVIQFNNIWDYLVLLCVERRTFRILKLLTHPEASVLPMVVPHVIVHNFIEAVSDVVTPHHVHVALRIEI